MLSAAEYRDVINVSAPFILIVINEAVNFFAGFFGMFDIAEYHLSCTSGTDQHDSFFIRGIFVFPSSQKQDETVCKPDSQCQAELDNDTEQIVGNRHPVYAECYGDKVDHACDCCSDDHTDQFRVACESPDAFVQAQEPEYYYTEYCIDPYRAEIGLQVLFLDAVESAVKADPQCGKVRYQNCYKVIYHQQQSDQFPVFKFFLSVSSAFAHFLLLIPSLVPFLYFVFSDKCFCLSLRQSK